MNESYDTQTVNPSIEKYVSASNNGIETHKFTRCVIGYILNGEKYVYYDDKCYKFSQGDLFFLGMGCHYTKNIPAQGHPYEQILVRYTSEELQRILLHLNIAYKLNITNNHQCDDCRTLNHATMPGWSSIRRFFSHIDDCLTEGSLLDDPTAENLKMTELLYLIVSHGDCCIKSKLLGNVDAARDNLQQIVYSNIFSDISVEEIAKRCNRSLTSFKKEFFRIYGTSPHQWLIRQRLIHARLLLISTDKAIAEIGTACAFPNTSHFIKLFRKQYGMTPATYRNRHRGPEESFCLKCKTVPFHISISPYAVYTFTDFFSCLLPVFLKTGTSFNIHEYRKKRKRLFAPLSCFMFIYSSNISFTFSRKPFFFFSVFSDFSEVSAVLSAAGRLPHAASKASKAFFASSLRLVGVWTTSVT